VTALWTAQSFVPSLGTGSANDSAAAVTAVGFQSVLANNVTLLYSFYSFNQSLDISIGGIDHTSLSCRIASVGN
jgi:hypothetical protein